MKTLILTQKSYNHSQKSTWMLKNMESTLNLPLQRDGCARCIRKMTSEISNYRPITLLNTDYKIYTKTLAIKLADVAHKAIHPNQAGFMPGRSIFGQVMLARMMVNYAEVTEENGLLVALDQEKAYDKIVHDYLWRTLEKYNVHENFTRTVRSLYELAETMVIINGMISSPFQVSRGIRQ